MAEYIEKQAATMIPVLPKEHRKYQTMNLDDAYENGWYDALECVEKIPPADVRPVVRGRWIPFTSEAAGDIWYCSACGIGFAHHMNFCPHCGADMRGGGNADGDEKD
jgi:rubrerythrin